MADDKINKLVMIASSTGGPKALQSVIPRISKSIPAPIVIVQHMPKGFTATLASRLNDMSEVAVSEVVDREYLKNGHVYLAAGGKHLEIAQDRTGRLQFRENNQDPVNGLRPCANVTLQSIVPASLDYIVCVVLTGMGADGYLGVNELRANHNIFTIAQNKETCVVYGMPRAIVEHGIADTVLPLERIGTEINKKMGVH
jgi:two-component system chemotaxis response regulator CheB